ncbi:PQQ-binding-like beta-propeller repeat protein [bacterium]|nr:PQQ-binding-like beta-propeller repeat protein [bacterium]
MQAGRSAGLLALGLLLAGCTGPTTTSTSAAPPVTLMSSTITVPESPEPPTTIPATTSSADVVTATGSEEPDSTAPTTTALPDTLCPDLSGGDPTWWVAGFDLSTGAALWAIPSLPVAHSTLSGPSVAITLDNGITAVVDAATCTPIATIPGTSPGSQVDGRLLLPDRNSMRSLDPVTGDPVWETGWPGGSADIRDGAIAATGDAIVAADAAGRLILLDRESGRTMSSASHESLASAPGTVHSGSGIWVLATSDGNVTAFEEGTLDERWSIQAGPTRSNVDATGPAVIAVNGTDVIALDPATGIEIWRVGFPGGLSHPVVDHDEVHVLDEFGRLHHLSVADGSSVFVGTLGTDPDAAILLHDDPLTVVTEGGLATGSTLLPHVTWVVDLPIIGTVAVAAVGTEIVVLAGPIG